jgi:hypothetical protein
VHVAPRGGDGDAGLLELAVDVRGQAVEEFEIEVAVRDVNIETELECVIAKAPKDRARWRIDPAMPRLIDRVLVDLAVLHEDDEVLVELGHGC